MIGTSMIPSEIQSPHNYPVLAIASPRSSVALQPGIRSAGRSHPITAKASRPGDHAKSELENGHLSLIYRIKILMFHSYLVGG